MIVPPQLSLDLNRSTVRVFFAGGGGACEGIRQGIRRSPTYACNHNRVALGMHRMNHPETLHFEEDVFRVAFPNDRNSGMDWFSPDCRHFSKAKGGKPVLKNIRNLIFCMLKSARERVPVMFMECVEEIRKYGPLLHHPGHAEDCICGKPCGKPDPNHIGRTWDAFIMAFTTGCPADHPDLPEMVERSGVSAEECVRGFGYDVGWRELKAYHYGAATIRKRLYMVARCDGRPIVFPEPTHYSPAELRKGAKGKLWHTVSEFIDWTLPCPSIFLTKEEAKDYRCKRPLVKSTCRRLARGIDVFVMKAEKAFIVNLTHQGGDRVESIKQPARCITGANRGEKALAVPFMQQHGHLKSNSKMVKSAQAPLRAQTTNAEHAVVAPILTEHANASTQRNFRADESLRTQCANVKGGHFALATGTLVHTAHGEVDKKGKKRGRGSRGLEEPSQAILSSGDAALAACHLTKFNTGSTGSSLDESLGVITANSHSPDTRGGAATVHGMVAATLVQTGYGERDGQAPRALDPHKPIGAIVGTGKHALGAANMVKLRGDAETHGEQPSVEEPMHAQSAGGTHHGVSMAYLAQHNGGFNETPGHEAEAPISAITQTGSQQAVVMGSVVSYYGSEKDGQGVKTPLRTQPTKARMAVAESAAVTPGLTPEQEAGALRVAAFLREHGVEFEGPYAMVGGYVIIDIGMRMLTPRELYLCQGFPADWVIDRALVRDPETGEIKEIFLTKEEQIRLVGNSVSPPVAKALVEANCPHLIDWSHSERRAA